MKKGNVLANVIKFTLNNSETERAMEIFLSSIALLLFRGNTIRQTKVCQKDIQFCTIMLLYTRSHEKPSQSDFEFDVALAVLV